ncbi:MAG TPA: DUF4242 domain-containing protein [Acidimicrobiia bacterium]|nr:DUF4242 domain-containing protein [Acidimicrobiia bacterium]
MPRYMVERTFPTGLEIPSTVDGLKACLGVVDNNASEQVTWVQSFVTDDHQKTFCVYDGPSPEAIRRAAGLNSLPIDKISEISVLDPYFYVGAAN